MIPKNIKREHIVKALEEIKKKGIPKRRKSKKFLLKYNGEYFPPKYVISLANRFVNGEMLPPNSFGGGDETNGFLIDLGFEIVKVGDIDIMQEDAWKIEFLGNNPFISRIIFVGDWVGTAEKANKLLNDICDVWPEKKRAKFIITCGGFVNFKWPEDVSKEVVGDPKYPSKISVDKLITTARKYIDLVLDDSLKSKLQKITDYITIGADASSNTYPGLHTELVFLVDLKNDKFYCTGKSYPTKDQENGLVRITNLKSHFLDLDIGKVMILGCHDLTIFNPRSWATAKYWRKKVNENFRILSRHQNPLVVLQHPHVAIKVRSWLNAWNGLKRTLSSVKFYTSAWRYFETEDSDQLSDVLARTTSHPDSLTVVVYLNE